MIPLDYIIPTGYRALSPGETLQPGDLGPNHTWTQ